MRILRGLEDVTVGEVVASREAVVAIGEGEVSGEAAAVLLFADYAVLKGSVVIDSDPAVLAGLVWRFGSDAYRMLLSGITTIDALDATEWRFEDRSALAFDAAAQLIARRGGDRLERAEFAWLFATGEPQEGLAAFLEKRRPGFRVA